MNTKPTLEEFLSKVESFKKKAGLSTEALAKADVDLATTEDLSIAVMNLVSLEEHFFFTGVKTGNGAYFDTIQEIRGLRKQFLAELMPHNEGETWCIAKHLLAATMRLIEVGNKLQSEGKKEEARRAFEGAYATYSIFWALKLGLIEGKKSKDGTQGSPIEALVNELADCCNE